MRSISLALSSRAQERNKRIKEEEEEENDEEDENEGRVSPQSVAQRIERPGLVIAWQTITYLWDAQLPWEAKTDTELMNHLRPQPRRTRSEALQDCPPELSIGRPTMMRTLVVFCTSVYDEFQVTSSGERDMLTLEFARLN